MFLFYCFFRAVMHGKIKYAALPFPLQMVSMALDWVRPPVHGLGHHNSHRLMMCNLRCKPI